MQHPVNVKAEEVNPFQVFNSELKIHGSHGLSGDFRDALILIQSGAIDVSSIITHRLPLEEFTTALKMMQHPVDSVKILVKPELS